MGLVSPYQMENLQITHILYPLAITASLILSWLFYHSIRSKAKTPPEPPRLPIIGHLHLLYGPDPLHVKLAKLADKYGSVMHLQVGVRPMLVISNPKTAKDCFTTKDRAFASRPRLSVGKILGYDFTLFPWAPYSSYWRELRRISNPKLLSTSTVRNLSYILDDTTRNLVRGILERSCDGVVEIREHLLCFLMGTVFQLLGLGLEKEEMKELVKLVEKAFYYGGMPVLGDAFPWLRWFDLKGAKRAMTQIAKEIDSVTHLLLDERVKMVGSDGFLDGIMAAEKLISTLPTSTPERKNSMIISLVK